MTGRNRPIKGLHGQALKDFRHAVSLAKKKGLVSKRVDARKQKPTRYMRAKMASLADVFGGTSVGVKVAPKMAREYRQAGFKVFNNRVVVAKSPGEIASVKRERPLMRRKLGPGIYEERLVLPITPTSIEEIMSDVEGNQAKYDALKDPSEVFAFKLFGRNSLSTFEDFGLLIEYLSHYQVFEVDDGPDTWEGVSFYRVASTSYWKPTPIVRRKRGPMSPERRAAVRHLKSEPMRRAEATEYKRVYRARHEGFRQIERDKDRERKAKKRALERQARADRGE